MKPVLKNIIADVDNIRNRLLQLDDADIHPVTIHVEDRTMEQLNPFEMDVIRHLVNGCTNKETGAILYRSARTIDSTRARICQKIGAKNMVQAVFILSEAGIITRTKVM